MLRAHPHHIRVLSRTAGAITRRIAPLDATFAPLPNAWMVTVVLVQTHDAATNVTKSCLFDCSNSHALDAIERAMASHGTRWSDVDTLCVSHAHLDHAAAAGLIMRKNKNMKLVTHPGVRQHLVDPARLLKSARLVYGDQFDAQVGEMVPVDAERVFVAEDGEDIDIGFGTGAGAASVRAIHTRGHANFHSCFFDPICKAVYTGDSFGMRYAFAHKSNFQNFSHPTTSPIDFHFGDAMAALDKITALEPDFILPTHSGILSREDGDIERTKEQLQKLLQFSETLRVQVVEAMEAGETDQDKLTKYIETQLYAAYLEYAAVRSAQCDDEEMKKNDEVMKEILKKDSWINASGVFVSAAREVKKRVKARQQQQ